MHITNNTNTLLKCTTLLNNGKVYVQIITRIPIHDPGKLSISHFSSIHEYILCTLYGSMYPSSHENSHVRYSDVILVTSYFVSVILRLVAFPSVNVHITSPNVGEGGIGHVSSLKQYNEQE